MTETKTPGQIAYEGDQQWFGQDVYCEWTDLGRLEKDNYESIAAAVRAEFEPPLLERIAELEQAVSLCSGSCGNLLRECAGELTDLQSQRIAELEAKVDDLETENGRLARQLLPFLGIK